MCCVLFVQDAFTVAIASQRRTDDLSRGEVEDMFKDATKSGLNLAKKSYVPNPADGEVYFFDLKGLGNHDDFRRIDSVQWRFVKKEKKLNDDITRKEYHCYQPGGKKTSDFKRYMYINKKTCVGMMHYRGDAALASRTASHGNATRTVRPYQPTNLIVQARIREMDPEGKMTGLEVYNKLLTDPAYQSLSGNAFLDVMPRNIQVVKNVQSKIRCVFIFRHYSIRFQTKSYCTLVILHSNNYCSHISQERAQRNQGNKSGPDHSHEYGKRLCLRLRDIWKRRSGSHPHM